MEKKNKEWCDDLINFIKIFKCEIMRREVPHRELTLDELSHDGRHQRFGANKLWVCLYKRSEHHFQSKIL